MYSIDIDFFKASANENLALDDLWNDNFIKDFDQQFTEKSFIRLTAIAFD